MTKTTLREQAKNRRNSMSRELILGYGENIRNRLYQHVWFTSSHSIFIYVSTPNEVPTYAIIEKALEDGKTVSVPRVSGKGEMHAIPIQSTATDLIPGHFGIMEPKPYLNRISPREMDLILVPGLLFDRKGYRIGYGGGYYDKYLAKVSTDCKTIGLAYDQQITNNLPHDSFDKKVMLIITEKENIGG